MKQKYFFSWKVTYRSRRPKKHSSTASR